jgi:uncharacterized protein (DUF1015 family)
MRVFPIRTYTAAPALASRIACTSLAPDLHSLAQDEKSYLRVVKPQLTEPGLRQGSTEFMEASLQNFQLLLKKNALQPQENACWLYVQELADGRRFEGWIIGISALDYEEGKIRKHENTIREKENRLSRHIRLLGSVAEPVLLAASLPDSLSRLAEETKLKDNYLDFKDPVGRRHVLWKLSSEKAITQIQQDFAAIPRLYIADGHHRSAATCLCIRDSGLNPESNGVMALVLDKKSLSIKSFHRIIQVQAPAWKLEETCRMRNWEISRIKEEPSGISPGSILALSSEGGFLLEPGRNKQKSGLAAQLDVARLESELFPALFGIENSRIDSRISFLRGDVSYRKLQEMLVEGKAGWIFIVAANTMDDIEKVADAGEVMPPKSTWVEPKLMTGMLVMQLPGLKTD